MTILYTRSIVFVLFTFLSFSSHSQVFTDVSRTSLVSYEYTSVFSEDVESADLDGDGDLDITIAGAGQRNLILFNTNGSFNFDSSKILPQATTYPFPVTGEDSRDVELADFDGDGDIDMLSVSGFSSKHEYLLNDGTGVFTFSSNYTFPKNGLATSVLVGDIGGDTLPDVIIGSEFDLRIYINDGDGTFTDSTSSLLTGTPFGYETKDLDWVDIDGDGDLDIVEVVSSSALGTVYINNNGVFTQDNTRFSTPVGTVEGKRISPADIDNDGDIDLYLSTINSGGNGRDVLLINDGVGNFSSALFQLPFLFASTYDAAFLDLNYDGYLDIVCTLQDENTNIDVLINDPSNPGYFMRDNSYLPFAFSVPNGLCLHLADFNEDGKPDIYFGNRLGTGSHNGLPGYDKLLYSKIGVNTNNLNTELDINVFPNPASHFINIQNNTTLHAERVVLYNMNGQVVIEKRMKQSDDFQIDIDHLSKGTYLIVIEMENQEQLVKKVIVH